ncbi:Gfo/Idh/MocA family protein [Parvularcula dongshanensis]|uniref:Putative dehydrogenase n=1 Tax=Parvularcula dongshanensis TaxID=1173995 RepID=A0A840I111_9PROT|nr:Gfo/Idh/MocA family oxidoreductase [Parvularcula dongshanensis]MBB4657878.1 putative dehydrogenase [Parvularcula dongshanensis]
MQTEPLQRRAFLQASVLGLGASLAGAALGQEAPPNRLTGRPAPEEDNPLPIASQDQLGWAVAGVGHFAQNWAIPGIAKARRAKLAGLITGSPDKAARVGAAYGLGEDAVHGYDMKRLADDDSVDVVYVITPNALHEDLVIRAFEAGKHVMCEKPMAPTPAACQRMIDAGKAAGRKLMVAYRAHFEPYNQLAKDRMAAGDLGEVWYAASDHHRPMDLGDARDQWRAKKALAGGGSLVDIGIYGLNGLIWFLGEAPSRVRGTLSSPPGDPRFAEVEAFARVELDFPSGRSAVISSGYTGSVKRIDLVGEKVTATLNPATEYRGNALHLVSADGTDAPKPEQPSESQFGAEIDHLCQAVQEGTEILTPGEMGLRDVELLTAIYRSAETGDWVETGR